MTISPERQGEQLDGAPDVTLTGGYLAGQRAMVTITVALQGGKTGGPSLTAMSDRSRIVISGGLDPAGAD